MKRYISIVLLFATATGYCQPEPGVWGKVPPKTPYSKTVWLFTNYTQPFYECKLDLGPATMAYDSVYFIIGDTTCKGQNLSYVVVKDTTRYLMMPSIFVNKEEINKKLQSLKINYPDIHDRYRVAVKQMPVYLKQFKREKDINDSLETEMAIAEVKREEREFDSVTKVLDKIYLKYAENNLVLWNWSWSYENEYSRSVDVNFTIKNPYRKKIKYVWVSFRAFNPVDDPVKDGISGKLEKTVQGIGPIEYRSQASYNFESVFYSKVIGKMRITMIKIQFFDGTTKIINKPIEINPDGD